MILGVLDIEDVARIIHTIPAEDGKSGKAGDSIWLNRTK